MLASFTVTETVKQFTTKYFIQACQRKFAYFWLSEHFFTILWLKKIANC